MHCLTHNQIETLLLGVTPPEEQIALLEHIADCDVCAEALAARTMALPCVNPPRGMAPQVLKKAQAKRENLRSYSLRVFAAMAAALVLLFSGVFQRLVQTGVPKLGQSIQTQFTEWIDYAKEGLNFASESK